VSGEYYPRLTKKEESSPARWKRLDIVILSALPRIIRYGPLESAQEFPMRYQAFSARATSRRPGMVLLVVMAMLALFASVAISFVFYADSEAEAARLARQAQDKDQTDIDPELLASYFLNQVIYGTDNIYSAMRGWDLATSIYGNSPGKLNYLPYAGVGRAALAGPNPVLGIDNRLAINYQKFDDGLNLDRIPEFYGNAFSIKGATNTNPIVITTATPHGLANFDQVAITGVQGNTAANGGFSVTVSSPTSLSLNGSKGVGAGAYTGGGAGINQLFYRAGNPPWTSYDSNSLFLAMMRANGTVLMPSFSRPWLPPSGALARYTSLFPDRTVWNPKFITPDTDATGDVKNLEFGPGGNDSKWMDLGFPVMTAPNGKRYRPLFAPLIIDLSNRIHLWAHGNRDGGTTATGRTPVSNMGMGPSEINVARAIGVPITATGAAEAGGVVTIKTSRAHGFADNDKVLISGVGSPGYDGVFDKIKRIDATTFQYSITPATGLAASGHGVAIDYSEWMSLFNLKYGGYAGTPASNPGGAILAPKAGTWYSLWDFDGLDPVSKKSTRHFFTGFKVNSTIDVNVPAGPQELPMFVTPTTGTIVGGFPWAFFDAVTVGTPLLIADTLGNNELVAVKSVSPATNSFTAIFSKSHLVKNGTTVTFSPYFGFPTYPLGWNNLAGETSGKGLGFSFLLTTSSGFGVGVGPSSSLDEALIRFGGTNSPAVTSEIFRRMPSTFSNIRARNMVTLWSMDLDRVGVSPYITFDPNQPGNYKFDAVGYPKAPITAVVPPDPSQATKLPATSEYGRGDWRSTLGQKLRVNLNRSLTPYPVPDPQGLGTPSSPGDIIWTPAKQASCQQAVADRQEFAWDIYNALVRVTGAQDPNVVAGMVNTSDEYKAARWLAQLAVNIVDYIDEDNNITPFNWYPAAKPASDGWVFGTEQPALVLNEVYAQQEPGRLNVWLELHNPYLLTQNPAAWTATAGYGVGSRVSMGGNVYIAVNSSTAKNPKPPPDRDYWTLEGTALLTVGANGASPVYKVEIHRDSDALTAAMRDPANHQGLAPNPPAPLGTQSRWSAAVPSPGEVTVQVKPSSGAFSGGTLVTKAIAAAPTGATEAKGVVTITTTAPHTFSAGQAVTIAGITGTGTLAYNGTFNIETIIGPPATSTSFTYRLPTIPNPDLPPAGGGRATFVANGNTGFYVVGPQGATYTAANHIPNLPATLVSSQMSIVTGTVFTIKVSPNGAKIAGTTVTITTNETIAGKGGLKTGDVVTISGVRAPRYNGTVTITSVIPPNSFTFTVDKKTADLIAKEDGPSGSPPGGPLATVGVSVSNVSLLLRRLANPRLPVNPNPGPLYNPYITVDYLVKIPVNIPVSSTGVATGKSVGRRQPYTANSISPQAVQPPGQPFNTFFTQNSPITSPFTWLTHLDRPPVNQLELMHVSAFKPHELTHQFITPAGRFKHYAPWNDPQSLLYRALDVLGMPSHVPLTTFGVRRPGYINLNTITEPEIFQALCDSQDWQTNPLFKTTDVTRIFNRLKTSRNLPPGAALPLKANLPLMPTGEGTPFQPLAAGDINKTWLRPDPLSTTGQPLFAVGTTGEHPYRREALLQKIFNNITTTSNVFGVWWTVGYFEVEDETVRPARLGKEIGRDDNRHIRHRFFAVVDRSGLELFRTSSTNFASIGGAWNSLTKYSNGSAATYAGVHYTSLQNNNIGVVPPSDPTKWAEVRMFYNPPTGSANGVPFVIQPGMLLDIGSQVVSVQKVGVDPASGKSYFTGSFPGGASGTIICRGNPGPRQAYNPRRDSSVVLYMTMIQ
jgi:hypothetical protein